MISLCRGTVGYCLPSKVITYKLPCLHCLVVFNGTCHSDKSRAWKQKRAQVQSAVDVSQSK